MSNPKHTPGPMPVTIRTDMEVDRPCGCTAVIRLDRGTPHGFVVDFTDCPLHAQAPAMKEALEAVVRMADEILPPSRIETPETRVIAACEQLARSTLRRIDGEE